jgi:hypothetical protein
MSLGKYQGNLSADREEAYGRLFANYLRNPENFFVISSDFCHWGQRFGYTFHDTSVGEIYQVIGPKACFRSLVFFLALEPEFCMKFLLGLLRGPIQETLCLSAAFNLNPEP